MECQSLMLFFIGLNHGIDMVPRLMYRKIYLGDPTQDWHITQSQSLIQHAQFIPEKLKPHIIKHPNFQNIPHMWPPLQQRIPERLHIWQFSLPQTQPSPRQYRPENIIKRKHLMRRHHTRAYREMLTERHCLVRAEREIAQN